MKAGQGRATWGNKGGCERAFKTNNNSTAAIAATTKWDGGTAKGASARTRESNNNQQRESLTNRSLVQTKTTRPILPFRQGHFRWFALMSEGGGEHHDRTRF
mmetsp:Transcript_10686/g.29485  ORF Transcript_10686/g.29485 Transcript_10686/m.29485 type:complete len:102 (-) Transcript_10686:1346-1651(-)